VEFQHRGNFYSRGKDRLRWTGLVKKKAGGLAPALSLQLQSTPAGFSQEGLKD
jgi:hypothetical protein